MEGGIEILVGKPTIVSSWFCPFAQRSLIALEAKGVPYTHHELSDEDLYSKPAWFLRLNPAGLVPTIVWLDMEGGERRVLGESLIINEWVDEALPGPSLMPSAPYERAKARLVIDRFASRVVPEFYRLLLRQDKGDQEAAARGFSGQLEWLAETLHAEGPFALGDSLSLVDCAVLPFLLRLPILQHYRGYELPATAAGRISAYVAAALAHPAVQATTRHPGGADYGQALIAMYQRYADGTANSLVARDINSEKKPAAG